MSRRRAAAAESGFTLVEVLLAMSLMLIVFSATLAIFTVMERGTSRNQKLNDSQQQARVATDTLARRLRNLASPANGAAGAQQPLEFAGPQDLIFRTVKSTGTPTAANPQNLERYRYCLGANKKIYEMVQTWSGAMPAVPSNATCTASSPGWTSIRVIAENVVNAARPLFYYQGSPTPGTYSELTSVATANFPTAIALRTNLYVDPDTANPPSEVNLNTRVFLRNQNRPPIASFTVTPSAKKVTLNGSESEDPEGNTLSYQWFDGATSLGAATTSAILTVTAATGSHSYTLVVTDVGNLSTTSSPQTITCSSTACN
jgi:prepilin-type N-terminal cleavage/methylation domain-containing protein